MLKKLFFIIIILIVAITALSAVLLFLNPKPQVEPPPKKETVAFPQPEVREPEPKTPEPMPPTKELDNSFLEFKGKKIAQASADAREKSEVQELARFYIINFGTYSASNFEHIVNIKNLSNYKVKNYLDSFIRETAEKLKNRSFYSIKTEVINISFESIDIFSGFAKANVSCLRIENEPPFYFNRSFEQKADLWLVKTDEVWQVVRVEWRE